MYLDETTQGIVSYGQARRAPAKAHGSPAERAKAHGLVDVRRYIPGLSVDLRYASADNLAQRALYPAGMPCLLREETAAKLKTAQGLLRAQGYGLRLWDAYRPPEVQETLSRVAADTHLFLSPESLGWSRHCGGVAVDVTLVDTENREQRMPTGFDAPLKYAAANYQGKDKTIQNNLQILQKAMKEAGFTQVKGEWWHFDDGDFVQNPQPIVYGRDLGIPQL